MKHISRISILTALLLAPMAAVHAADAPECIATDKPSVGGIINDEHSFRSRSYEQLAAGPWKPRGWSGRPFVFLSYAGPWTTERGNAALIRAAYECKMQRLLPPTWEDIEFRHPIETKASEWDNAFDQFLHTNPAVRKRLVASDRQTCYEAVKDFYLQRLDQVMYPSQYPQDVPLAGVRTSMTGHSWYSVYAAEWGCDLLGQEIGITLRGTQSKLAFLRGAARQNGKPMFVDVSPWLAGKRADFAVKQGVIGTLPVFKAGEDEFTPHGPNTALASELFGAERYHWNGGHSPSSLMRLWYMAWLGGVDVLQPEAAQLTFFAWQQEQKDNYVEKLIFVSNDRDQRAVLSPIGKRAQAFLAVTERHPDRGIPFTPFAVVLDQYAGFGGQELTLPRPWGLLEPMLGDREICLFWDVIFPGSLGLETIIPQDDRGEQNCVGQGTSPFGDTFDVLTTTAAPAVFKSYPVLILLGEQEFSPAFVQRLEDYLCQGGHLCLTYAHVENRGPELERLRHAGRVELFGLRRGDLEEPLDKTRWNTGACWGFSDERLEKERTRRALRPYEVSFKAEVARLAARLADEYLPLRVEGHVEFSLNRTVTGWVVGLINHQGIGKRAIEPAVLDASKKQTARITARHGEWKEALEWTGDRKLDVRAGTIQLAVPAGEVRIVEFRTTSM